MAVNFLYKSEEAAEKKKKLVFRIKTVATEVLVVMVVLACGMLGAWVYIRRESARLAGEEDRLEAETIKLVGAEARVWQIDDRARIVVEEAEKAQRISKEMRQVTPRGEVEIVSWGGGGGKGKLEAEAGNPDVLEGYVGDLRATYPHSAVGSVAWSINGKWRMSVLSEGGK